jgi:ribonucleoside-diphosphate reductase alpha chain
MQSIVDGSNRENREFWAETIKTRVETGEPYIMYLENSNKFPSERLHRIYKKFNLKNTYSNICSEILLPGDVDHTFVCCISSLPVHRFKEWRDLGVVRLMVFFLDAVLDEFIDRAKDVRGLEKAVRFAKKSRAIGIGVLGYHTFLQNENLPFGSLPARSWNKVIFRHIKEEAEKASQELAKLRGEPEWCQGEGFRNTHLMAIAPTATNSVISGHVSPGIEPWPSAFFNHKTAKATFTLQNPTLLKLLEEKGKNTPEVWKEIRAANGSVQTLEFLSDHEKEVFLTAGEMDMRDVVDAAADRQAFIDQGQSLNLFFYPPQKSGKGDDTDFANKVKAFYKYVNETHIRAWKAGVKTIYYCRSKGVVSADTAARGHDRKTIDGAAPKQDHEGQEAAKTEPTRAAEPTPTKEEVKAPEPIADALTPADIEPIDASYDECKFCT